MLVPGSPRHQADRRVGKRRARALYRYASNRGFYHKTHNVVYYQEVSKVGCALLQIRQAVVLKVRQGFRAWGKAELALNPKSLFSTALEKDRGQNEASPPRRYGEIP